MPAVTPEQKQTCEALSNALIHLRLLNLPLDLLMTFGSATFQEGCKRIVNGPQSFASSCLRVNQSPSNP